MKQTLQKANAWLWSAAGRRPWLLAILSGVILALAFPPLPLAPLIYIGFVPLLIALESQTTLAKVSRWKRYWRTFKFSYVAFIIWNLGVTYWLLNTGHGLENADKRFLAKIGGMMAILLNPILMSLPILAYTFFRKRLKRGWAVVLLVEFWTLFEVIHLHWELTWSWVNVGHAFAMFPFWVQYYEFTGILGGTALVLGVNGCVMILAARSFREKPISKKQLYTPLGLLLFPVLFIPLYFVQHIPDDAPTKRVRILQPNIDPYAKFSTSKREQVAQFVDMARSKPVEDIDLVIFPETAIPFLLQEGTFFRQPNLQALYGLTTQGPEVLSGIMSLRFFQPGDSIPVSAECRGNRSWESWNAATLFGPGLKEQVYQKGKLVPFSERVPYMETLEALKEYEIDLGGGFGSWGLPDSLHLLYTRDGTGILPAICYESIFGAYIAKLARNPQGKPAGFIIVITNDGWWKQSSGYLQHSAYARLRAIETRRWVARSANTGESSFIGPNGAMHQATGWWEPAVIDREIPLSSEVTVYMRHGDWLGKLAGIVALLSVIALLWGGPFGRSEREE